MSSGDLCPPLMVTPALPSLGIYPSSLVVLLVLKAAQATHMHLGVAAPPLCMKGAASAGLHLVYRGRYNCLPIVKLLWLRPLRSSYCLNATVLVSAEYNVGVFSGPLFSHKLDHAICPSSVPSALSSAQHRTGLD